MINLINKTIKELSDISKNAAAKELEKINLIKNAIEKKSPDTILKILQSVGYLQNFFDYWEQRSSQKPGEIQQTIAGDRPIIEILIDMHILSSINTPSKIQWAPLQKDDIHLPEVRSIKDIEPEISDYERLADLLEKRITRRCLSPILQFAETVKVPAGRYKGQKLDLRNAPYARRPLQLMGPDHKCQLLTLMWPTQSMKSFLAQIVTCFYTKILPTEILWAGADKESVRKTFERRLTPMLMDLGVEFISATQSRAGQRTGDVTYSKEFPGGNLDGVTYRSTAGMAQESKRLFIADEAGQWKTETGNQGGPFDQGWTRLKTYLEEKKCLIPSTPTDEETCLVFKKFLEGTQEQWFVPCPICGHMQILDVRNKDGYGLDWRTKRGRIIESSIVYVCEDCARSFKEKSKFQIQQDGEWRKPNDAHPINAYTYSMTLHALNSMFESWLEIATAYERGLDDPIAKKSYDNFQAGQPHKQRGTGLDSATVMKNRGEYPSQTVPDGVLFLTLGGDVQGGAERWKEYSSEELEIEIEKAKKDGSVHEKKFPRIEIEIFGSGPSYRGWSIDYQIFYGHTDNAFTEAFEKLNNYAVEITQKNGGFGFLRESDGMFFPIVFSLIDSGHNAPMVYRFCHRWGKTYPSKGERIIAPPKDARNIDLQQQNFIRYRKSRVGEGDTTTLYTISTKLYKKSMYGLLSIPRIDGDIQSPGFQDFPRDYTSRYFEGLTAEEKLKNGEYDNRGRYNEPTDCRVLASCAADIYLDHEVERFRHYYKTEKKLNDMQIRGINQRFVITMLAKKMKIDERFLITRSAA